MGSGGEVVRHRQFRPNPERYKKALCAKDNIRFPCPICSGIFLSNPAPYGGRFGGPEMAERSARRPERALTARLVETVTKPGKYFDGEGLFLRVRPNGSRAWVQRIVIRGKRCELGLGAPPAVPLAMARKLALENRGKAVLGADPLQERREASGELTFDQAPRSTSLPSWMGFGTRSIASNGVRRLELMRVRSLAGSWCRTSRRATYCTCWSQYGRGRR